MQDQHIFSAIMGEMSQRCYRASSDKGFWKDYDDLQRLLTINGETKLLAALENMMVGQKLALMHSEISEGLEGARKHLPSDHLPGFSALEEEIADVFIRAWDLAGRMNLRLGEAVLAKLEFNASREHMHGKSF